MILHFIQDLFHVLVVLCLLHSLAAAPCTQYDYSTASSVTVSNYNQLNCAVFYEVPLIYVNQTISFSSEIVLPSLSNITVQGSTSDIALRTSGSARLFNVTRAQLSLGNLLLLGDVSGSALNGGLLFSQSSTLLLSSVSMTLGTASCGSSLYALNSTIRISDSTVSNSSASGQSCGGSVFVSDSSLSVLSSSFTSNKGAAGGAIFSMASNINISGSRFTSNAASVSDGGALRVSGGTLTITTTSFLRNTAAGSGGGIELVNSLSATIVQTNFTSDSAASLGGSIFSSAARISLTSVSIKSATANNGGGLAVSQGGSVVISSSQFAQNQGGNAGAIFCVGSAASFSSVKLYSTNFLGNVAINSGGAIQVTSYCSVTIQKSQLTSNVVLDSDTPISLGGAVSCQYGNVTLIASDLTSSQAVQGSAIYSFFCNLQILSSSIRNSVAGDGSVYCTFQTALLVQNSTFFNNTGTTSSSGIICLNSDSCDISSSTFLHNTAAQLGVVQMADADSASILDSDFGFNSAEGIGGAVYLNNIRQGQILNSHFYNNSATTYGGSIAVLNSDVSINSTTIRNSFANSGGALYLFQLSEVSLFNCSFQSSQALDSGGAIYVGDQSILRGDLVTLSSCEGPYGGALYMSYKSSAAFRYLKAQNNIAGFSGGVFGLFAYASLTVSDSFITSNQAFLGGAFSLQYYCSATVTNTRFSTNTANSYGGVAYVLISSSLAVSNCNLTSNSGTFGGGAFFVESSSVNVTASTIDGHEGNVGGGIYAISGEIEASDTVFSNNGGSTYEGGTVYLSASSSFRSQRCNFTANQAEYGGVAAIVQSSFFSFQDSITQCSGLTGPCLYALQNSTVVLTQSDISDNEQELTSTDGLFHIDTGILRADGITVKNNVVQSHGVFGLFSVAATFTNTTFSKNRAKILTSSSSSSASGAIYIACTSPCVTSAASKKLSTLISGSTFLDNIAESGDGGAVYISSYPGKVSIDSSTFQNNEGKNGGAVSVSLSLVSVTRSSFVGNVATEGGGAIFWIYSNIYPTTVDESSSALSSNNFASYGQFTATDLVFLSSYFPTQYKPVSGKPLNSTIEVYLKDYYGQVVTNTSLYSDATLTIYCSVYKDSGVVKGSSTVPSKHGVAGFTQIVVTGVPGENTTLVFSVPISNINDTYQTIHFRECESGEITTSVGDNLYTCQECGLGTYSFYPSDTSCNICPDHAYCPGANVISVDSGYWRVNQVSASVLECPQRDPCLGGSNTSTQCAEGSYGPYCSLCETGYTASRSGICYSCEDSSDTARELVSTVLFIFVGLMAMVAFKYRKRLVAFYSRTMKAIVKNRKFRTLRVKVKIVVAFCQIVYQLGPALNIVFPASFFEYLNYYAIFQLNLLLIPNVSCMVNTNYYDGLLVSTISPFLFFAVIVVVIQFLVIRARRLNERNPSYKVDQAKRDVITAAFLISYFVMVNVSTQIFRVFQCEEFDDGNSYLVADYSIDCNAPNRSFYVAYGVVMIFIYPIGIPLAYAIVLFSYRKKINPDWRKVIDSNEKVFVSNRVIQQEKIKVRNTYPEIDNIRNLFDSYTPKRWYFELFDCARRLCLGAVPVLIFRGSSLQIIIVLLISLFSVASFMYFNPYIHEHDNHLAILSQWSITLIVIAALIIKVQALTTDPNDNQGLGVVLILLNLIIITFAIATAFMNSKETSDDDPKGLFGEDIEVDEDDEDDEEEGKKEEKKDKKKRSNGSIIGLFTNPMRSAARKKDDSQPGRSVDSDVGSDGEADEDDRSLDSDDDNYQSRVSSSRRSTAQVDEERSNHRGHESNEARDEGNSRSRSVLSKVFSSRTKSRSVASGGTSTASTGGVELHVMKTQHNPMIGGDEREENESIERETKGFEEFSDQHPVNTEPLPHPLASAPAAPPRSFLRSNDAAIDSDDDEA